MTHSRGKHCGDKVLLNVIEDVITFCILLSGYLIFISYFEAPFSFFSFSDGRIFNYIKLYLSSLSIPWGAGAAESPSDNKGKDIKAHKQHTAKRKDNLCVYLCV